MGNLQTSTRAPTPIAVVQDFLAALEALDLDAALAMMTDDVSYQNVPLPPDRGKKAVARTLRGMLKLVGSFEVRMHHIAANGNVVLTERTDILRGSVLDLSFWVCGTFEVRDGKVSVWRDRFDVAGFLLQVATSPVRRLFR